VVAVVVSAAIPAGVLVCLCADEATCVDGAGFTVAGVDEAVLKPDTESFATAPLFDGVGLTEGKSS